MGHDAKQLLKGTLVGGLAIFLAHGFGWGALPFANRSIRDFNDPSALAALQAVAPEPGTYFVNADPKREGLAVAGAPWGWMTVHAGHAYASQQSGAFVRSILINFGWALLASWIVLAAGAATFLARFKFGLALTLFGLLMGPVWEWSWGWYSPAYAAAMAINTALGFLAMSAVIAWLVRPAGGGTHH